MTDNCHPVISSSSSLVLDSTFELFEDKDEGRRTRTSKSTKRSDPQASSTTRPSRCWNFSPSFLSLASAVALILGMLGCPLISSAAVTNEFTCLDLMVLYTSAACQTTGGKGPMRTTVLQAVAEANQVLTNSQIQATLQLVYFGEISYAETDDMGTDLEVLTRDTRVRRLRDAYYADLVCFLVDSPMAMGGFSWGSPYDAELYFTIVQVKRAVGDSVFTHEIGHILGCGHELGNDNPGGVFPYSHGCRLTVGTNLYRTVMAYKPGLYLPFFSNPRIAFEGVSLGDPETADNARTFNELAPTVARGRTRPESPPSLQLASDVVPPDGPFELLLSGETGRAYQAQTSEDLRQWQDWTNLVLEGTCARLTDETAGPAPRRFYRVLAR